MENKAVRKAAAALFAVAAGLTHAALADVTVSQKTTMNVGSVVHIHGASTTNVTGDKKREDTETHCEGMLSLFCGNLQNGEIVRLDKDLTWRLEPKKKLYREEVFATPEQLAAVRAKVQANLEKMRSCPVSQDTQPVDKSKCEMAPPKIESRKTGDKMSIAGHDSERTMATLTESCTDRQTGDVCETVVALDVWLTQDKVPGTEAQQAFARAYAKKLGLDDAQGAMRAEFARYLGPYQSQIKQLSDKAGDFKGLPLRTSLRVLVGGPHCANQPKAGAPSADGSANPLATAAQTGKALTSTVGKLMGGMFGKKKADDTQAGENSTAATSTSTATPKSPDPYAQLAEVAAFSMETVSISADPVPAERFEVPADWKKEIPKPQKGGDDEFTCPKTGT